MGPGLRRDDVMIPETTQLSQEERNDQRLPVGASIL